MSWHFSREPEGEFSPGCYAGRLVSALLSSPNILAKFSSNDNGTESFLNSQSGTMSQPSESTTKNVGSISNSYSQSGTVLSYLADSLVKTYQQQEQALGLMGNGRDCGASTQGSLAKYDQQESKWKTRQRSLFEDLIEFSETWPRWGILQGGEFWGLSMSAHHTREKGSGSSPLFPTPTSSSGDYYGGKNGNLKLSGYVKKITWPTPNSRDWKDNGISQGKRKSPNLGTMVARFPTPMASDCRDRGAPVSECDPAKGKGKTNITLPNDWWEIEPELGRMADGVANRVDRLKAIGNGQVPAVAAAAWDLLEGDPGNG